jgi:hypothetical protein
MKTGKLEEWPSPSEPTHIPIECFDFRSAEKREINMDPARQVRETGGTSLIELVCQEPEKNVAESGLESIHIHQTMHTLVRMVSEDTGSLIELQEALGQRNLATTRVYVNSISVKKNNHNRRNSERLGIS